MSDVLGYTVRLGILLLVVAGLVIGIAAFRDTLGSTTVGYSVLNNTLNMFENAGDQLSTVGTMIGIGLLIGVILIAFIARRQGMF